MSKDKNNILVKGGNPFPGIQRKLRENSPVKLRGKLLDLWGVPRSVQKTIPIEQISRDGIWLSDGRYSKVIRFDDVSYFTASEKAKESMLDKYEQLLNYFSDEALVSITINNHRIDANDFERRLLLKEKVDGLDELRDNANDLLRDAIHVGTGIMQEKYITVSVVKRTYEEAQIYFARVESEIEALFARLSSNTVTLDNRERARILHDFYRPGEEGFFRMDLNDLMHKGADFRDYICPDYLRFRADHFEMGGKVGRVLFLKEYANFLSDSTITDLTEFPKPLMLTISIDPMEKDKAKKLVENRLGGVEKNVADFSRNQVKNNNFSTVAPYQLEQAREELKIILDGLQNGNQRLMFATVTIVHIADDLQELNSDTEALMATARRHSCTLGKLLFQQEEALNTVLPLGLNHVPNVRRTLNTESTAILVPFSAQENIDFEGIYCGSNARTGNPVIPDRKKAKNGNMVVVGDSGSGKSFAIKMMILFVLLSTDDDVLIIDPQGEYRALVEALRGVVVPISTGSNVKINAMEIGSYGSLEEIIAQKTDFILSLCEQQMGGVQLRPQEKSIIDRCVRLTLEPYIVGGFTGRVPTLKDFYMRLAQQNSPYGDDIRAAIEILVDGSMNNFAGETNVDMNNRLVCYDIRGLGSHLKPTGMLVIMENIWKRTSVNQRLGKNTWIIIDEAHLLFKQEYTFEYLYSMWKRIRQFGGLLTAITQNITDLLQQHEAETMLANSECMQIFSQKATDQAALIKLLNLSDVQIAHISEAPKGQGLYKMGGVIVPFKNKFPESNPLYKLLTTKPGEYLGN